MADAAITKVRAITQRAYDMDGPAWLVMLFTGLRTGYRNWIEFEGHATGLPMARAVVDDFGNLVLVSGWQ